MIRKYCPCQVTLLRYIFRKIMKANEISKYIIVSLEGNTMSQTHIRVLWSQRLQSKQREFNLGVFKGLITLCVVSLLFPHVFYFSSLFCPCVFDTNMLVSKMQEKRKKKKKFAQHKKNSRKCFYITLYVAFFSRFCSQTLPKRKPNAWCNMGFSYFGTTIGDYQFHVILPILTLQWSTEQYVVM